jgi:transposase
MGFSAPTIYLAAGATDLRKGFEGLSDLVKHQFKEDPLSGHLFIFANRKRNRVKLLYSDTTGMWKNHQPVSDRSNRSCPLSHDEVGRVTPQDSC